MTGAAGEDRAVDDRRTEFDARQFDAAYPPGIEHHYWTRARHAILAAELRRASIVPSAGIVLDVGCGVGLAVEHLRSKGYDARGVEIATPSISEARQGFVRVGISHRDLPADERASVTTVLLLDVIEHLAEPASLLRELAADLPNLRHIVLAVPARAEIWSNYDVAYGHQRRYDLAMIEPLAAAVGAEVLRAGYCFHALYWAARVLLARPSARRHEHIVPPAGAAARLVHRLLAGALIVDDRLLPRRARGSSIFAILRLKRPTPASGGPA